MHIPASWTKATGECQTKDNRKLSLVVWGWGNDDAMAKQEASSRLDRLIDRIRRGEPFPDAYAYGGRPLREEILQRFDGTPDNQFNAILTRNRYGALVLNTARLLFLDIDLAPPTILQRIRSLFSLSQQNSDGAALATLREALRRYGKATFRLYRTAAGFRAIAIDREFEPAGREAQDLMRATGTDPAFTRLCMTQKSFRARLTPKPWRCGCPLPIGEHPRTDDAIRKQFETWLDNYELTSSKYGTCRYLETVGSGVALDTVQNLIALHDRVARCDEALPLA